MRALVVGLPLLLTACGPRVEARVAELPGALGVDVCARAPAYAEPSTFFSVAEVEDATSVDVPSNGDLWPSCSSGTTLYTAWGDGFGLSRESASAHKNIGVGALRGTPVDPAAMQGQNLVVDPDTVRSVFHVWTRGKYYAKPTGMLCRFFSGEQDGVTWTRDLWSRKPVLVDCTRRHATDKPPGYPVLGQGGVIYDAPLRRYLYLSWSEYTFEFYEAPAPWGPWRRFLSKDFGLPPWTAQRHGGYGTTAPSLWVGDDGKTLWVSSSTWSAGVDHNDMALRKLTLQPSAP